MEGKSKQKWLTWRKIACVALLLLAALYIYAEPTLERWTGWNLPTINLGDNDTNDNNQAKSAGKENRSNSNHSGGEFSLTETGRNEFESPAGLVYVMGPRNEHRIDHIMLHARDDPARPVHGVFEGTKNEILALLDEAYNLIKSNDKVRVKKSVEKYNGRERIEYTVKMKRRIGFIGGRRGGDQGNPASENLKLILEDNRPITAYPTW